MTTFTQEVSDAFNTVKAWVEKHVVTEVKEKVEAIEPELEADWAAAKALAQRNGGALLAKVATDVAPLLLTLQWGAALAKLIEDAEAIGVVFIAEEKALAASTALQIAQAAIGVIQPIVETPAA